MVSAPETIPMTTLPADFLTSVEVEPVGRWFLSQWERLHQARGLSSAQVESEDEESSDNEAGEEEVEFEDDLEYLRSLDPKDVKNQDHYRVLGIAKYRMKATEDQIKRAHRAKVLRHHPDKRRALGEEIKEGDDYFTCITKAAEILSNPVKRRAYDSVDPTFDDDVPEMSKKCKDKTKEFFKLFTPAFEANARWSIKKHVPALGDDDLPRDKVDKFYRFWYEFESWREFSYLDEEDKEKGSDRDERRWIEKNNRVQRNEKKKEEMKRIRKLVDTAYNNDPRIQRFVQADKDEKLAKKKARADAIQARKDEEARVIREEKEKIEAEKAKKAAEDLAKAQVAKKDKEAKKMAMKRERKTLRNFCKENNYYVIDEDEKVHHLTELDRLCEILTIDAISQLNKDLGDSGNDGRQVFVAAIHRLNNQQQIETQEQLSKLNKSGSSASFTSATASEAEKPVEKKSREWSEDELQLLIKAVNLFPAGTTQRWEVVVNFIMQHTKTPEMVRHAKETLSKAKELQSGNFHLSSMKDKANENAYENLEKTKKREVTVESEASERTETAAEAQGLNVTPWSDDEQKLLEQSLKTFPSSLGPARWEKISEVIPGRSKKDCMKRYKELAELIRAKKAAVAATKK